MARIYATYDRMLSNGIQSRAVTENYNKLIAKIPLKIALDEITNRLKLKLSCDENELIIVLNLALKVPTDFE